MNSLLLLLTEMNLLPKSDELPAFLGKNRMMCVCLPWRCRFVFIVMIAIIIVGSSSMMSRTLTPAK